MGKKILVVVDVQNDFVTGSLGSKDAQAAIPKIVERISRADYDALYFTRDTHYDNYLETNEGKKLPVKHCILNTWGWNICDEVMAAANKVQVSHPYILQHIIDKPTFGSEIMANDIWQYLAIATETSDQSEVELLGFCTDICVVSNALLVKAAVFERAEVTVNSECCAGVTPELHEAALNVMKSCQINII